MISHRAQRAGAAGLGLCVDRLVGEPRRFHPVAGFGTAMGHVEDTLWRDRREAGVAYTATGVALGAAAGWSIRSTTASVAVCAAGRELRSVARAIGHRCDADDLDGARALLPSLVGRDPSDLDHAGIAAAVIESLAENMVDAVVAPALWGAALGAVGAGAYRSVNTMDAMVGHRSERYERFGWSAARLDDLANLVPARAFGALVVAAAPSRARAIGHAVRTQAPAHPSPNAGVAEASVAAALGVELGGPLRYGDRHEDRPTLGTGPRPSAGDIGRAVRLVDRVEQLLVLALVAPAAAGLVRRRIRGGRS
ncbi:CobD/CbiB family cobalamin biosynthesis protein [Aquihabitans daechungensis]|uniref:CobD/CbiB family cobalamin biosynthesis protein n=1 Tax=Aquihabitans daechungensis TaxID=1052257 RepID=UPI003BA073FC